MRDEKQLLLDDVKEQIEESKNFVLTGYKSLGANTTFDLRLKLRESGSRFLGLKKRLFLKALEGSEVKFDHKDLNGHIGLALAGDDAAATSKSMCDFAKDHKELVEILGGYIDGAFCTPADVLKISKLPSKDEMRASLLGLFEAPQAQTLSTMDALLTSVIHCLENKSQKET